MSSRMICKLLRKLMRGQPQQHQQQENRANLRYVEMMPTLWKSNCYKFVNLQLKEEIDTALLHVYSLGSHNKRTNLASKGEVAL